LKLYFNQIKFFFVILLPILQYVVYVYELIINWTC